MHFESGALRNPQFVGRPVGGKTTARHPERRARPLDAADVVQVPVTTPEHGHSLVRFTPEVPVSAPCTASHSDQRPDFQGPRFRSPPAHFALTCNALRRWPRCERRSNLKLAVGVSLGRVLGPACDGRSYTCYDESVVNRDMFPLQPSRLCRRLLTASSTLSILAFRLQIGIP